MSLNTVPTNCHEFKNAKFSVFKLRFVNTGRIHAESCVSDDRGIDIEQELFRYHAESRSD